jgi:hypothetical protein
MKGVTNARRKLNNQFEAVDRDPCRARDRVAKVSPIYYAKRKKIGILSTKENFLGRGLRLTTIQIPAPQVEAYPMMNKTAATIKSLAAGIFVVTSVATPTAYGNANRGGNMVSEGQTV